MADILKQPTTSPASPPTNGAEQPDSPDHASTSTVAVLPPTSPRYLDESEIEIRPPRRNRWRIALPVILVLAVAIGAAYFFLRPQGGPSTAIVRRGTIISTVETTGKLEAQAKANLSFKQSGRVDRVIAKQGDTVKAGDALAELDNANLRRNLYEAMAQLDISKLKLQQANSRRHR